MPVIVVVKRKTPTCDDDGTRLTTVFIRCLRRERLSFSTRLLRYYPLMTYLHRHFPLMRCH